MMQRNAFLAEVEAVLDATERDYHRCLEAELSRALDAWLHDSIQLLAKLDAAGGACGRGGSGGGGTSAA